MDRSGALHARGLGRIVVGVAAAALIAARLVASPRGVKPSASSSKPRLASGRDEYARTVSKPLSASSAGISGWSAISGCRLGVDDQLVA